MKFYKSNSLRLQTWDYTNNGDYFITICTKNKNQYFGEVINQQMHLAPIGEIAKKCWEEIPQHTDYATLGAFCIMPDHMHGIITINNPAKKSNKLQHSENNAWNIKTEGQIHGSNSSSEFHSKISPKKNSIKTIIRSYKSAVSKFAHRAGLEFSWQQKYYDHIIRDKQAYKNIAQYIIDNPKKWIP